MNFFKIFRRKKQKMLPRQLRIDGVKTTMTPTPDDAEIAAQALLESRIYGDKSQRQEVKGQRRSKHKPSDISPQPSDVHDVAYYRELSERIKTSRAAEARLTLRYLTYCEEQLALPKELYVGQINEMEQELYKRFDIAEREGGDLKRRWQHCLAEVIVRQMSAASETAETAQENTDLTD